MTDTCTCSHARGDHGPTDMGLGNYLPGTRCQLMGCDCRTFTPHTEEPVLTDAAPHVTPETVRAVRDQLFEPLDNVHAVLTTAAADLEREQAAQAERKKAEEARIDEYARVAFRAGTRNFGTVRSWDEAIPKLREFYRVITRAVLAHLEREWVAAAGQGQAVGTIHPGLISVSPADGGAIANGQPYVHGRDFVVGERWPTSEPRTWDNLRDVPDDVHRVTGCEGESAVRCPSAPNGWRWAESDVFVSDYGMVGCAPYTEAVADA